MAVFDFFKKPSQAERQTASQIQIYELLFCDDINLYKATIEDKNILPWKILSSNKANVPELLDIIADQQTETRAKILAYRLLQEHQYPVERKELLAVIVEVALEQGLDVLASYKDGTARFISHSGKVIFWDVSNNESAGLTQTLFENSDRVVQEIGPWNKGRLNPPKKGNSRITFLVSDGLYFGEAPTDVLFNDPLAREALLAATALLDYLTLKAINEHS